MRTQVKRDRMDLRDVLLSILVDALLDRAQHAFVVAAQDLEEKFRVDYPQHEFWNSLKTTMIQLRKIYNNAILGTLCL